MSAQESDQILVEKCIVVLRWKRFVQISKTDLLLDIHVCALYSF